MRVRTRYRPSLVFRLIQICSDFKFKFSGGIQSFGLKTTSHGKPDAKNFFWGQIYHVKWFSGLKVKYPQRTWTWTCCKPGYAWKPGHYARSARERTACCINIYPRKEVSKNAVIVTHSVVRVINFISLGRSDLEGCLEAIVVSKPHLYVSNW